MKPETELINRCIKRDAKAEYALYKECYPMLMPICSRYGRQEDDAVDLLNRGFYKILSNLGAYDQDKPFDKWAKSILINTIIDEFRANKNEREHFVKTDMSEAQAW